MSIAREKLKKLLAFPFIQQAIIDLRKKRLNITLFKKDVKAMKNEIIEETGIESIDDIVRHPEENLKQLEGISRRDFLKMGGMAAVGVGLPKGSNAQTEDESKNKLFSDLLSLYRFTSKRAGGTVPAWLTVAYSASNLDDWKDIYDMYFLLKNPNESSAIAMIGYSIGDPNHNFISDWNYFKQFDLSGGFYTIANEVDVTTDRHEMLKLLKSYIFRDYGISAGILMLAHVVSGFNENVSSTHTNLGGNDKGSINAWLTLAYAAADALEDGKKQKDILTAYNGGGEPGAIFALAYAASNMTFNEISDVRKAFKAAQIVGVNAELLTLAYAVAANPDNKLFPRRD